MKTENRRTVNNFVAGRNTDTDPSLINPNQYISAFNVELTNDGTFSALTNINGTTEIRELTGMSEDINILRSFPNKYLIGSTLKKCITIFTAGANKFKIWCYDTENDDLYELFEEIFDDDYLTDDRVIDGVSYPENGVDLLYFTDFYNEVRVLKCVIPDDYAPNFLNPYQISLTRRGATGTIALDSIDATGGALLTGTYQFAYRMADPVNKRFTKWSTLTNPIHVYSRDNDQNQVTAGIGLQSTRKINLVISPSEIEMDNFEYYQLAVVENVGPTAPTTADLLDITLVSTDPIEFAYRTNASIGSIPLSDITVDLAQIERVKTLNVKQNILFGGNIKYAALEFDAGVPVAPDPPTVPAVTTWINKPGGQEWTLGGLPITSVNGNSGTSDYVCGTVATAAGSSYSFTITFEILAGGSSTPVAEAKIALLDSSFNELDFSLVNFTGAGVKNATVSLTPSSNGTYLALFITNNTAFDTKVFELQNAIYNTPSLSSGGPAITSGSIISYATSSADLFAFDAEASTHIGHFRNEVYRYGIVYEDEAGNRSTVSPLDFDGLITGNQITSGLPDIKFPDRSVDPAYSIINSSGAPRSLGLNLEGVKNHPSWACSFEIVRLPRKKNILFQTPVIPMYKAEGIGALDTYPSQYFLLDPGDVLISIDAADAQPMTSGSTYVPKNLFWPELRGMEKLLVNGGTPPLATRRGEVKLNRTSQYDHAMIFPPQSMYGEIGAQLEPFVFTGAEKLDTVDYALMRVNAATYSSPPTTTPSSVMGDYVDSSTLGSFTAHGDSQYFFDSATGSKSIAAQFRNIAIGDYEFFDNGGTPDSVAGTIVLDYEALQTQGVNLGYKPTIQRSAVVRLQSKINDLHSLNVVFKDGQLNQVSPGGYIFGASGPQYDTAIDNRYVTTYSGFVNNGSGVGSNVSAILISNVILGLGDDRYGDLTSFGEYISTGAKYTFTQAERDLLRSGTDVSVDIEVWGGDCFVGYHSFKVCDSTYSVMAQNKHIGIGITGVNQVKKWGLVYGDSTTGVFSMPVAVKNAAQYVQVCLESEYNGDVRDIDTTPMTTTFDIPHYMSLNESDARVPLSYKYNTNLSRGNVAKVFVPKPQHSFVQNEFPARIVWSDLKIYNSDQAGFDIIRAGNFVDLEESRYDITKLAIGFDQLYAIQQQGIVYLPTGGTQIEQATGGELAVRTGDVIGRPYVIDSKRGSRHLASVLETGGIIYIPDSENKSLYILSDREGGSVVSTIQPITKDNETKLREFFSTSIPEKNLISIYDPVKRQIWLVDNLNDNCEIFNEAGFWVGNHEFIDLKAGVFTNKNLWLIGNNTVNTMYTRTSEPVSQLFGVNVIPRVTFVVNPDESLSKTFDNIMISASERLASIDIEVRREATLGTQIIPTISLDTLSVEGNFRIKTVRDEDDARARGLRAHATIKWGDVKSSLQAVWTSYRTSARQPW